MRDAELKIISPEGMVKVALEALTHHPVDLVYACLTRSNLPITEATIDGAALAVQAVTAYLDTTRIRPGVDHLDPATAARHITVRGQTKEAVDVAHTLVPRLLARIAENRVSGQRQRIAERLRYVYDTDAGFDSSPFF
jgi:hypothetical protein